MANYIDGFVLPIPKKYLEEYELVAKSVANIWKEHGALNYFEFIGDDESLEGVTPFSQAVKAKNDEVVIFGWVEFQSKEQRNVVNKIVAADSRMADLVGPLTDSKRSIFDAKRMVYGGFNSLIS